MAKGFKHGAGGSPLNFKVVGYATEAKLNASTPKENTLGVVTTNDITGWHFTAEQPENMAEGELWFCVGASSSVAFNALKKNNVTVYPMSAKQMVSGALKDVTAKTYQNNEWVDWITYLYNKGDDCTSVTGGWSAIKIASSTGGFGTNGVCNVNADNFELGAYNPGTSISRVTNKMIDLTNVSEIHMQVSGFIGDAALFLSCGRNKIFETEAASVETKTVGEVVLNTVGLTGNYYVSVTLSCYAGQVATTATITEILYK